MINNVAGDSMTAIKISNTKGTGIIGFRRTGTYAIKNGDDFIRNTDGSIMTFGKKKNAISAIESIARGF